MLFGRSEGLRGSEKFPNFALNELLLPPQQSTCLESHRPNHAGYFQWIITGYFGVSAHSLGLLGFLGGSKDFCWLRPRLAEEACTGSTQADRVKASTPVRVMLVDSHMRQCFRYGLVSVAMSSFG